MHVELNVAFTRVSSFREVFPSPPAMPLVDFRADGVDGKLESCSCRIRFKHLICRSVAVVLTVRNIVTRQ